MKIITDTEALGAYVEDLEGQPFVAIDTEFIRESTYWPNLCLVQLAGPADEGVIVDPLAKGIDLKPLYDLLYDQRIVKVFHAARQDIEIFVHEGGETPTPLFDTQVAAMVMGFGDSIAYDALVQRMTGERIDKTSRFTDWARRPLSDRQLEYALSDVTHLRVVYRKMQEELARSGRASWVADEMATLAAKETYIVQPEDAWRRLKARSNKPRFLAMLKALAAWREREAQRRNLPRNRVVRDESIMEIAADPPKDAEKLAHVRGLNAKVAHGPFGEAILSTIQEVLKQPKEQWPQLPRTEPPDPALAPVIEMLKVLLKRRCATHNVAQKLVCPSAELERIAADDDADVQALKGWRRGVFGDAALDLKHGRIGLAVHNGEVIEITPAPDGWG
ncbi:ribonuclease D [Minwuia thermotolerans]|uniref:Ribonuclease D n=1 Tax=Minwuia thermotolerans TaxID=2056226 RepID=A0A2M9G0C3_9PROT|nr:ribonuclease D [Minwuia thermotolerans]PJK29153.1 ribonuclease D [Minwuia thermotolerans]